MFRALATGKPVTVGTYSVTIREKIGEGGYAIVYRCDDSVGHQFALKCVSCASRDKFEQFKQEAIILQSLPHHPNIVKLYAADINPSELRILCLFEYCPSTAIQLLKKREMTKQEVLVFFHACANAASFLHSQTPAIIHRDLKPENLLVDGDGVVKLCDFGSATRTVSLLTDVNDLHKLQDDIEQNTTMNYRSPEMVDLYKRVPIDAKSDVWALGCTLYKLIAREDMYRPDERLAILQAKARIPLNCDPDLERLIRMCIRLDPKERPTATQLTNFAFNLRGTNDKINVSSSGGGHVLLAAKSQPISGRPVRVSVKNPSSSTVEKWVVKATTATFYPPKEKHVRRVTVALIRNKNLVAKTVIFMMRDRPWQSDPRVAAKVAYLILQIAQFSVDLSPMVGLVSGVQSMAAESMKIVEGSQQKKNWAQMAALLAGMATSKLNFHRLYPMLEGNLSWSSNDPDPKFASSVLTMIRRTVALGTKVLEIASLSGDFGGVVFAQVFVEETINLFNVLRFIKPECTEELKMCTTFMEKAKKLPYLESCVEYPTDIVNAKPVSRF